MAFLHFVSEKFFMTVFLKDSAVLVKLIYKNNDCAPIVLSKFRTIKGMEKGRSVDYTECAKNDSETRKDRLLTCNLVVGEKESVKW